MTATIKSPSLDDGYNGARDAALLDRCDHDQEIGVCHVQATSATRSLLHRAGFRRTRTHAFYAVPVERDRFARLQIAPVSEHAA